MSQFVLLPWEHPFSGISPRPHATTKLNVGGKTRNFVLKLHDGTLYFKEPSRSPVFAVFAEFSPELAHDSIGLVSRWQTHVAEGNYGAFVVKRDYFPRLPVRAQILMVLHAGGTGWMREHFDSRWFMLPEEKAAPLDVWNDKEVEAYARERLPFVQRVLINRALPPEVLEADRPRWQLEDGDAIARLLSAASRLWVLPSAYWNNPDVRVVKLKAHSAFARGDIEGYWLKHAAHNPSFKAFWDLLEPRIQFLGVQWSEGGEHLEQYGRSANEKIFQAGIEKWGHYWRGNWGPQRASFKIDLPNSIHQSAHERLQATLTLREWLQGKMAAVQIEELFAS